MLFQVARWADCFIHTRPVRRAGPDTAHAKYKELPRVRARRIKTIEADRRKQERAKADAKKWLKLRSSGSSYGAERLVTID